MSNISNTKFLKLLSKSWTIHIAANVLSAIYSALHLMPLSLVESTKTRNFGKSRLCPKKIKSKSTFDRLCTTLNKHSWLCLGKKSKLKRDIYKCTIREKFGRFQHFLAKKSEAHVFQNKWMSCFAKATLKYN